MLQELVMAHAKTGCTLACLLIALAGCANDDQSGSAASGGSSAGGGSGGASGSGGTGASSGAGGKGGSSASGGSAGAAGASGGSAGASGAGGASCKSTDNPCQQNDECCGYDAGQSTCIEPPLSSTSLCAAICNKNADCSTGCCHALPIAAKGVCVPPEQSCLFASPGTDPTSLDQLFGIPGSDCAHPGESCAGNDDCCGYSGTPRLSACMDVKGVGLSCAATCKSSMDCKSGCCVPIWGTPDSLCLPYDTYCN
jgi:hypothetical protein